MSFSAASLHAVLEAHVPSGATGLVVGLSGGGDSASLLAATASLGAAVRGLPLRAVHVDHGLQAAAAAFSQACAALCAEFGVPLAVIPVSVHLPPGSSIEAAARDARYAALARELKAGECLLTAHHREDQAETVLLQAVRGAGLKGMSAMPVCRRFGHGWHVRPVLDVPQDELRACFVRPGASIADPMNEDPRFDRGYVRRQIWPLIKSRWPGAGIALSRTAKHLAAAQDLLERAAATHVGRLRDGDELSVPGLRALTPQERTNALRLWLYDAGVEPPSTARLSEALRQILDADLDHLPAIEWGDFALRRYRQRVFLTPVRVPRLEGPLPWAAPPAAPLPLGPGLGRVQWVPHSGGIDARGLQESLSVRRRAGGETIKPAVHAKTQSVQHLCQAHGVLPWMRDALPLLFAGEDLIAVGDLWVDARWCAAPEQAGYVLDWQQAPIIV
jgi:tRNA(Ile)-lysidine synthase